MFLAWLILVKEKNEILGNTLARFSIDRLWGFEIAFDNIVIGILK